MPSRAHAKVERTLELSSSIGDYGFESKPCLLESGQDVFGEEASRHLSIVLQRERGARARETAVKGDHSRSRERAAAALRAPTALFVFQPNDEARRSALRKMYPEGKERVVPQSFPARNFSVYVVK